MSFFLLSPDEAIASTNSNFSHGLSENDVRHRREQYGDNRIPERWSQSIVKMFFAQLHDWLIYILLVAVIITASMGEYIDALIILLVITINACLGVIQEYKANKAIDALKNMSSPQALVRRDGKVQEIASSDLVPGDIVILDAGRIVPADIRLIESHGLQIEESALTGESVPAKKNAHTAIHEPRTVIGDQVNMAFMSTTVLSGRGEWVVVNIGSDTEVGHIAHALQGEENIRTPLEHRLNSLGKTIGKIAIVICVLMFIIGLFQGRNVQEMFLIAVSLAVASIPEGLAAIVAVVLSIGVTKMSRQNAIIKRLPAVETLGSVDTICSDKTGTLTQNRMTVMRVYTNGAQKNITPDTDYTDTDHILARSLVLSSDATYEGEIATGDPTEIALLIFADTAGVDRQELGKQYHRLKERPFDSDRKMMSTFLENNHEYTVYTKGAVDNLLEISTHILIDGKIVPLNPEHKQSCLRAVEDMSDQALRTIGAAYKTASIHINPDQFESDMIFIGFVGMIDPPRPEAADSIRIAQQAGITPIMITGDYPNTAFAIAQKLSIASNMDEVLRGKDIDAMNDDELENNITSYRVFARVSPEHKVRIVRALRSKGKIVSMTGDGVNDAPSLHAADIGVAMGITGTDVAKWAADMILLDDNFTTIIRAVEAWRNIYNTIKTTVIFLLSSNLWEVVAMFFVLLIGWESPLLAIQLLWINLITDSFPAVALGMSRGQSSVMRESPRNPQETFFSDGGGKKIALFGIIMGGVTILAFFFGYWNSWYMPWDHHVPESILIHARTLAFMTLIFTQMLFVLSIQHEYDSFFLRATWSNLWLIGAVIFALLLQFVILFTPFLRDIFHLSPLSLHDWDIVLLLAGVPLVVNEIRKYAIRKQKRRENIL